MRYRDKQKQKEYSKRYYEANKEKIAEKGKAYREANKEKIAEKDKSYYETNKEHKKLYNKANKEKIAERSKFYREANKEKIAEDNKFYRRKKLKTDPKYKLDDGISRSIRGDLKHRKSSKNSRKWEELVGYTTQQLVEHLEKQFDENMTWENQGSYWHIDHIKPKSLFTYDEPESEEFRKCWALENLRPLEAKENLRKSNKYNEEDNE